MHKTLRVVALTLKDALKSEFLKLCARIGRWSGNILGRTSSVLALTDLRRREDEPL
jgi:hypothetical protein